MRWLEERGPEGCLIDMVDDATNTTLAQLGEQETIWAVADALRAWIERYGVPLALYVDWKNLYKRPCDAAGAIARRRADHAVWPDVREAGDRADRRQFPASEGARGAGHGTHQDRLVKKLRRKEISSHEQANVYLEREYLPEHNRRFARAAARPEDYHRRAPRATETGQDFPARERTHDERGLGGALRQPVFSSWSRRVGTTRRPEAKYWCAKGGTAA